MKLTITVITMGHTGPYFSPGVTFARRIQVLPSTFCAYQIEPTTIDETVAAITAK